MSVEHITYQGKRLPVKLGYYALKMLQKEHGIELNEEMGQDIQLYEPMLYYSLKQGHKLEGEEFTFRMEDMEQILDECFFEFVALIPKFFPSDLSKMMGVGGRMQRTVRKVK